MPCSLDSVAERYVKLVLAIGHHDPDYVDAYYGPPEWRSQTRPVPLNELMAGVRDLSAEVEAFRKPRVAERAPDQGATYEEWLIQQRRVFLARQIEAAATRLEMLQGTRLKFDEESRRLYDIVAPHHDDAHFAQVLEELSDRLPGSGALADRYEAHRTSVLVPPDRLPAVFGAALDECRRRTLAHIDLPRGETFRVEFVSQQPWTAYNWYQGQATSRIEVNTDLPMTLDRALDLACHEGYPGHHVYNALLESHLTRQRGWIEFSIYPLFSPASVIAEGTANLGIEIVFPNEDRLAFERETLFPLAGLDPGLAPVRDEIRRLVGRLHYAGNEAARRYLDGDIDADAAASWLMRLGMFPEAAARQRVRFFERYRSYVITYNVGLDLARAWVDRQPYATTDALARWQAFASLLLAPRVPSELK